MADSIVRNEIVAIKIQLEELRHRLRTETSLSSDGAYAYKVMINDLKERRTVLSSVGHADLRIQTHQQAQLTSGVGDVPAVTDPPANRKLRYVPHIPNTQLATQPIINTTANIHPLAGPSFAQFLKQKPSPSIAPQKMIPGRDVDNAMLMDYDDEIEETVDLKNEENENNEDEEQDDDDDGIYMPFLSRKSLKNGLNTRARARRLGLSVPSSRCAQVVTTTKSADNKPQCVVCMENDAVSKLTRLKCKHYFCAGCLKEMFLRAMKDETEMPPKCCSRQIPAKSVYNPSKKISIFRHQELEKYNQKKLEYATADRVYCCDIKCGIFIAPKFIKDGVATCTPYSGNRKGCKVKTCARCKKPAHINDLDCSNKDTATAALEELAKKHGWRQCVRCKMMVELRTGCYHITYVFLLPMIVHWNLANGRVCSCRCRYEFCYLCGKLWDPNNMPCGCSLMDAERLVAPPARPVPIPISQPQRLAAAAAGLVQVSPANAPVRAAQMLAALRRRRRSRRQG
jgi:hypothetical protein